MPTLNTAQQVDHRQRGAVLRHVEDALEAPMFVLSLVWIALLVVELTIGAGGWIETATTLVWIVFVLEFGLRFVIAPKKLEFLRRQWLTVLALVLPALRVFRAARVIYVLRAGRAVRGLTLARVLTSFNRGLRSLRMTMGRFGFGYVAALSLLVTTLGSAGMYAFERPESGGGIASFGDAVWFTAMIMTTLGSEYWPKTPEGRMLCVLLSLYAFAVFGYVTATLATVLIGHDTQAKPEPALDARSLAGLRTEIAALRAELRESKPRRKSLTSRARTGRGG